MKFLTREKISEKREKTPEGFLLCRDVVVARTGTQVYGRGEVPVTPGPDGQIRIERDESEVFRPATMASANGKDLTVDHPDDDVCPANWRELAHGFWINARRGTGDDSDVMLMDLIAKSDEAIKIIENGTPEVSVGYDAEYEEIEPGRGRQRKIVINHIALVDSGRCGPRCSIGDRAHQRTRDCTPSCNCRKEADTEMKSKTLDRLAALLRGGGFNFKDEDLAEIEKKVTGDADEPMGGAGEATHVHVHLAAPGTGGVDAEREMQDEDTTGGGQTDMPAWFKDYSATCDARFDKIEKMINGGGGGETDDEEEVAGEMESMNDGEEEAVEEEATGDSDEEEEMEKGGKTRDSAPLADAFQQTVSLAEIIAPGVGIPTFDARAKPQRTVDAMHRLRARCIDLAWNSPDTRTIVEELTGGKRPALKRMKVGDVRAMFRAVGAAKRRSNSRDNGVQSNVRVDATQQVGPIRSLAELNKRNAEHYKNH